MQKKQRRKINRIKKAIVYWKKRLLIQGTSSPSKQSRQIRTSASKQRKVRIKKRIHVGKDAKANKAKPYSRKRHQDIILAYRNVLELPSARELRKIICSKRNTKRKIHTGSTDIYFVSYMSYPTYLASVREKRGQVPAHIQVKGR